MGANFYIEEYLDVLEDRIKKCEDVIGVRHFSDKEIKDANILNDSYRSLPGNTAITSQNRLKIGQNSLMANIENEIQQLNKVKDDDNIGIHEKLDIIESIIKRIYSLGPLENWLASYETIKAYLEMDSADFESSVLTLDARKAYVKEHYYELEKMREQLEELRDLIPYINEELDISSINEMKNKLNELELRGRRIGYETNSIWKELERLSFTYSNFIYKYNSLLLK